MYGDLNSAFMMNLPPGVAPYITAGFFAVCTVIATIVFHLAGARVFIAAKEKGGTGPKLFGILSLILGVAGTALGITLESRSASILVGLASGFFIWTALGEVGQEMGWVSLLARSAVPMFLACTALWLACFLVDWLPPTVLAAMGYPVLIWGINLTRVRVISKWGPASLPATILALVTASIAGGGIVLGILQAGPVSGIIGGVVFAMATWSVLEMIWERGTARRPWRRQEHVRKSDRTPRH